MTPIEFVQRTVAHVRETDAAFASLYNPRVHVHPIPFFGPLSTARVLTLGLNPSSKEFTKKRVWPLTMTPADLCGRLEGYFNDNSPAPAATWFNEWTEGLKALGVSYQHGAAHIDLSPRPTLGCGRFREAPQRDLFIEMLRQDVGTFTAAFDVAQDVVLVMAAGSATNRYYINEFIDEHLGHAGVSVSGPWKANGPGTTAFQNLHLPGDRVLPMFFCSTGPTRGILAGAVRDHADALRAYLD